MDYPWYQVTTGSALEQGDILEECPVFNPPADLSVEKTPRATFTWQTRDVVLMSQSCDMVLTREKIKEVLLCSVWKRSEFKSPSHLATDKGMEDARRGNLPGFHVFAACNLPDFSREVRVVEFSRVYSLPVAFIRKLAERAGSRLRLMPPYREHLSQAYARFFMRVGLPVDIPSFVAKP